MDPRFPLPPPSSGNRGHHRRAISETFLRFPDADLLLLDPDDGAFSSFSDLDFPFSLSSSSSPAISDPTPPPPPPPAATPAHPPRGAHSRSLSLDAAFFDGLALHNGGGGSSSGGGGGHKRTGSMDGTSSPIEGESAPSTGLLPDYAKKAMPAERIAELALIDPKRAKRILANRLSATRSKERKVKYTGELERKVQTLQTEATTLSAHLTFLQRDTTGLSAENRELKLRLQSMEEQAKLRDALNDAMREEVQRLKIAAGQAANMHENPFNSGLQQQIPSYFPQHQHMSYLGGNQAHHRSPSHHQSSSNGGQSLSGQSLNDSMDFI